TLTRDGLCAVWDLDEDQRLPWVGEGEVGAAVWAPDGRWLALGTPAGEVRVHAFPDGEVVRRLALKGPVRALAVSAAGRCLAVAGDEMRVWDGRAGAWCPGSFPHPGPVGALAFNPLGDRLATSCPDGRARVFAVPGGADDQPLFPPVPHDADFRLAAV